MRLVKLALRVPASSGKPLELPSFALTSEEKSNIKSSPFFRDIIEKASIEPSKEKKVEKPKPDYIQRLTEHIPLNRDSILSDKLPKGLPSPFEVYKKSDELTNGMNESYITAFGETAYRVPVSLFPRLSVTKLLTKSWCELRDFYRIYAAGEPKTESMALGSKLHQELENTLHPPINYTQIEELVNVQFDYDLTGVELRWMFENLLRLRSLLTDGEARELYIFGFLNINNGELIRINEKNDLSEFVPITGMIDYLRLDKSHPFYDDDIHSFIKQVENEDLSTTSLSVIDVKTRSVPFIPKQPSVVESSKLQIMYYAHFIKQFDTFENSVKLFETFFKYKGIDIDAPLDLAVIISFLDKFENIFLNDFRLIQEGEILHDYLNVPNTGSYEPLELELESPVLRSFLDNWAQPITLRYFILRNTQLLCQLSKLVNANDLNIQYYFKDALFKEVNFSYDEDLISKNNENSMNFWFGRKYPEPIEATYSNATGKCKYCDFKDYCPVYEKAMTIH